MSVQITPELEAAAMAVAQAVAAAWPAADPLVAMAVQPGSEHVAESFAACVAAPLPDGGQLGVLVTEPLAGALAQSPMGPLSLPAAAQPALDAGAQVRTFTAGPAADVPLGDVAQVFGDDFVVIPLVDSTISAAVLVSAASLLPAQEAPTAFVAQPGLAQPHGGDAAPAPVQVAAQPTAVPRGIELLNGVLLDVTVELGRAHMSVRDLLALSAGTVLELDRAAGSPADLLVNGRLIARGEVVVVDENFGLRVTEIIDAAAVA